MFTKPSSARVVKQPSSNIYVMNSGDVTNSDQSTSLNENIASTS